MTTAVVHPEKGGFPLPGLLLRALLCAALACASTQGPAQDTPDPNSPGASAEPPKAMAEVESAEAEPPPESPVVSQSSFEKPFRTAIGRLETEQGAYAEGLSEQLLSLGLTLQRQGRHGEALDVFKRGVHLARINHGLYSSEQLALLQAEIASHMATGQLSQADERQQYLYRVQMRSLKGGEPMAAALMQQASWQYSAYRWEVGGPGFLRLMNMWDLYRLALNDIVEREGDTSKELLPPLYGMLRAQYLISQYNGETESGFDSGNGYSGSIEYNRFNAYRHQSYDKGQAVIQAIYQVEDVEDDGSPTAAAEALIMLGDWYLWHEQRESAFQAYAEARGELVELDDAQSEEDRLFGEPVALPSLTGVRPLPRTVDPDSGDILIEFSVTGRGRVVDVVRLDENEVNDGIANRLMRKLRKTPFRPRFEQGEPVKTENIVWAYDIEQ